MFKLSIINDWKHDWQSYSCVIEEDQSKAPYYYNVYIDGFGQDNEEAIAECLERLNEFIKDLSEFRDSVKDQYIKDKEE